MGFRIKQLAAYTLGKGYQIKDAELALENAIALNPELLSALSHLVAIYVETGLTNKAVETARHVLEINLNSAENHLGLGYVYRYAGFLEEAEKQEEIALNLDPDNPRIRSKMGMTQIYLNQYEEALNFFELDNDSPFSLAWQGQIHLRMGHEARAMTLFNQVMEMDQEGVGHWVTSMKSYLEEKSDQGLQALELLEVNLVDAEQYYNIANLYGLLGYKEHCIRTLRIAIDQGFFCYPVFLTDKFLDSVRNEPGFQEVLEEARTKHEEFGRRYF